MNRDLEQLYKASQKPSRYVIGLMSGTSLDGLDIAYCEIAGSGMQTKVEVKAFKTIDYDEEVKDRIRAIFAKETISFSHLVLLNDWLGIFHGKLVNEFLKEYGIAASQVDFIGSHGQTVLHLPKHQHQLAGYPNATLQIGDGDHIAVTTGITTVADFRQKHVAKGGEGAPLAVYGDLLIFSSADQNRIMLNIGGIANFTYLPQGAQPVEIFVTDTGPGNTMMDGYMKTHFGLPYDKGSEIALKGHINQELLANLKNHYYFRLPFPKTTGPEVFNQIFLQEALSKSNGSLDHYDVMATLNRFSAETIAEAIEHISCEECFTIYMSGGGMHNLLLVRSLTELLPNYTMAISDQLGIKGDAKEAVLFAVLANETVAGNAIDFGDRQGFPSTVMGKISFPN